MCRRQIVQKVGLPFLTSHLETPKDVATESGEAHMRERALYHHANFHANQREIFVPGQKIHIFDNFSL